MKTVKSLLLGSAAGFVAFTGAQAADLPMAEPVEYVKVCSTYGEGFFYIPGTDTCLQISGKVRVEGYINFGNEDDEGEPLGSYEDNDFETRARGVIAADARTETEWGTLRSYVEFEANNDSEPGAYIGDGDGELGIEMVAGFIQFAGITAGFAPSFYDFVEFDTINDFFSTEDVWTLAYTASFGSGFAATIAIEDKSWRSLQDGYALDQTWPNVIAALRVDQAWGSAQLSGAVQDNEGDRDEYLAFDLEDDMGFAVQAGAKFNLPFANEGSYFFIQGAYSEGAVSYAGGEENIGFGGGIDFYDQSLNAAGDLENNELWQVGGGVGIQATETVRMNLVGSYSNYSGPDDAFDIDLILVEGNVFWTPVDNLDLGVAVLYGNADYNDDLIDDTDDLNVTFRIERGF